ncbi:hypothetical protein L1887_15510 [Cichorium endivia]|nr:hypothetical protein L1887_15510 [Cichorium endivia]
MSKSKILVVGGTGYIGKRIVKASLAQGHPTFVLMRREIGYEVEKLQTLLSFKQQGTRLVEGSFSDHQSLVDAVKEVDVVICTMSGVQFRSHNILLQLKLVDAIKEAGNVKRFLPSEFGIDPSRMENGVEYGNRKVVFMDEDDVATYTIKSVDDPRTLNKTLYLRPHENILTHNQLVEMWEKLTNKTLQKVHISAQDFLASMKDVDQAYQAAFARIYKIFYDGCLMNFEIGEEGEEASNLYPEVRYTRMDEYLQRYL